MGRAGGKGRGKGNEVIIKVIARIDLLFAIREVWVFPILLWAATGKMFGHTGDALRPQRGALKATDIGADHLRGQVGVFAKGAVDACPARFCRQVRHRVDRHADADGAIFLTGNIAKFLHKCLIAYCRQAKRLRPLGKATAHGAHRRVVGKGMARIAGKGDGDAKPGAFGQCLHLVLPFSRGPRLREVGEVEMVH